MTAVVGGYHRGWWLERGYTPIYSPLCATPCAVPMAPGEYHLAISKYGRRPVIAPEPVVVDGPTTVGSSYVDRSGLRLTGWVVGIAGGIAGLVMMAASIRSRDVCDADGFCDSRDYVAEGGLFAGGVVVFVVSEVVGWVLVVQRDEAHVSVASLTLPSVGALRESPLAAIQALPPPEGASLKIRF